MIRGRENGGRELGEKQAELEALERWCENLVKRQLPGMYEDDPNEVPSNE